MMNAIVTISPFSQLHFLSEALTLHVAKTNIRCGDGSSLGMFDLKFLQESPRHHQRQDEDEAILRNPKNSKEEYYIYCCKERKQPKN